MRTTLFSRSAILDAIDAAVADSHEVQRACFYWSDDNEEAEAEAWVSSPEGRAFSRAQAVRDEAEAEAGLNSLF